MYGFEDVDVGAWVVFLTLWGPNVYIRTAISYQFIFSKRGGEGVNYYVNGSPHKDRSTKALCVCVLCVFLPLKKPVFSQFPALSVCVKTIKHS